MASKIIPESVISTVADAEQWNLPETYEVPNWTTVRTVKCKNLIIGFVYHQTNILLPSTINFLDQEPGTFNWIISDISDRWNIKKWWNDNTKSATDPEKWFKKIPNYTTVDYRLLVMAMKHGFLKAVVKGKKRARTQSNDIKRQDKRPKSGNNSQASSILSSAPSLAGDSDIIYNRDEGDEDMQEAGEESAEEGAREEENEEEGDASEEKGDEKENSIQQRDVEDTDENEKENKEKEVEELEEREETLEENSGMNKKSNDSKDSLPNTESNTAKTDIAVNLEDKKEILMSDSQKSLFLLLARGELEHPLKPGERWTVPTELPEAISLGSSVDKEVQKLKELEEAQRRLDAYKFDLSLKIFLEQSKQILVEEALYQKQKKETQQVLSDRNLLGDQIVALGNTMIEKEKCLAEMEDRIQNLGEEIRAGKEKNARLEFDTKAALQKQDQHRQLIERANMLVQGMP
ncbi:hypothetical protein L873DRAFT_1849646 [Choiromyces venosus 120613-1]|uniref:Uncharacterized protein n=1 Tax=Choiromyces venosus 120613-1 TaxID=1336337 RepID=A0A3N4J437_9PEZI|nr:hypothetical protein L873DRAFT_1849646 [Choiromyces venosus 120613-1]